MTLSRIAMVCSYLTGLALWLIVACTTPTPTSLPHNEGARLYTRTPNPTVTPTPTVLPQVYFQEGLAQRAAWDLEAALERFDTALSLSPDARFFASRAEVYRLMGRFEDAAADIESALELTPELTEAWRQKALLSRTTETWDEALAAIDKLIELEPDDGAAYVVRAQILAEGFGKLDQALFDYRRAARRDAIFDEATLVEQWHILAELGYWKEALQVSRKMATPGNENPLHTYFGAWSLIQLGELDQAIQTLFAGIKRYPDYPVTMYYALGVAYYERRAWSEAIQALEVALNQSSASSDENALKRPADVIDADILGYLGLAYLNVKQCETGAAIVERAIDESPDPQTWLWARQHIEECYISITPTPTPTETPAP